MKDNDVKFTVLIPAYNCSSTIKLALESVNKQTYQPEKIVVVDDGSSDNTSNLLYELKKIYINLEVISLPTNSGIVNALRTGVEYVDTNWVARLDADDLWCENHLELLVENINADSEIVLCANRSLACKDNKVFCNSTLLKKLVLDNPFIHSATAFKYDTYLLSGGYNAEKFEDYGLWIRMLKYGKGFISANKTVNHIKSSGSLSDIGHYKSRCYRFSYQMLALEGHKCSKYLVCFLLIVLKLNSLFVRIK